MNTLVMSLLVPLVGYGFDMNAPTFPEGVAKGFTRKAPCDDTNQFKATECAYCGALRWLCECSSAVAESNSGADHLLECPPSNNDEDDAERDGIATPSAVREYSRMAVTKQWLLATCARLGVFALTPGPPQRGRSCIQANRGPKRMSR